MWGKSNLKQFNTRQQHKTKCEKNEGVLIHSQGTVFDSVN